MYKTLPTAILLLVFSNISCLHAQTVPQTQLRLTQAENETAVMVLGTVCAISILLMARDLQDNSCSATRTAETQLHYRVLVQEAEEDED